MEQLQTSLLSWIKAFLMMSVASREDPGVVHENGVIISREANKHWVFYLKLLHLEEDVPP